MKVRSKDMGEKEKMLTLDALYTAAGTVKGREAMKGFLRDLLTESERLMLGRRIQVARLLIAGSTTREAAERMGMGLDTVRRIEKWLHDQLPGYEHAVAGLKREYAKRERKHDADARFAAMKRKYPLHFLFFPYPKGYNRNGGKTA